MTNWRRRRPNGTRTPSRLARLQAQARSALNHASHRLDKNYGAEGGNPPGRFWLVRPRVAPSRNRPVLASFCPAFVLPDAATFPRVRGQVVARIACSRTAALFAPWPFGSIPRSSADFCVRDSVVISARPFALGKAGEREPRPTPLLQLRS